jgi:hypothetical protein
MPRYVLNHNFKYVILTNFIIHVNFEENFKEIIDNNENDESIVKVYNKV